MSCLVLGSVFALMLSACICDLSPTYEPSSSGALCGLEYASLAWCMKIRSSSCFFFFFQAEDGIRDLTVTGVQTCALPISSLGVQLFDRSGRAAELTPQGEQLLPRIRELLHGAAQLREAAGRSVGLQGRCRIGFGELSGLTWQIGRAHV